MPELTVDLHGYPVWEAVEVATASVQEAWEQGKTHVTLIHGAPDIRHWTQVSIVGRGGIKWELRGCLARGEWLPYAFNRRSRKRDIGDGYMTLAIRRGGSAPGYGCPSESSDASTGGSPA